jgi:hypothetical protein
MYILDSIIKQKDGNKSCKCSIIHSQLVLQALEAANDVFDPLVDLIVEFTYHTQLLRYLLFLQRASYRWTFLAGQGYL